MRVRDIMVRYKTEEKCVGKCGLSLPEHEYDKTKKRPTWFGLFFCDKLVEWVCKECYDEGKRTGPIDLKQISELYSEKAGR